MRKLIIPIRPESGRSTCSLTGQQWKNIPHDNNDCAIAAAILALAQKLNLQVTAEGIETYDQIDFLSNLGCDELQGYLLSKPVDPEQIPYLIKKLPDRLRALKF